MEAFLVISFREGLEAFLVLGIVLAFLQKQGLNHVKKFAWIGFALGILGALVFGFAFSVIVDGFESEELQYNISLVVLFIAIILLTYMVFWIQSNSDTAAMREKIELSANQKLITFLLVFTAIFREGMELVLFTLALLMGEGAQISDGLLGLGIGFVASGIIVWLLFKSSIRLPLKQFFQYTSLAILFIVSGLVSLFIKGMQGNEFLPIIKAPLFDISSFISNESFLGKTLQVLIGYDAKPSLLQMICWASYLVLMFIIFRLRKKKHA